MSETARKSSPRHAVILVPGISEGSIDQSVEGLADRLAAALQTHEAEQGSYEAHHARGEERFGKGLTTRIARVSRRFGRHDEPVIDLFDFDYRPSLCKDFDARSPLSKAWLLFWSILVNGLRLVQVVFAPGRRKHKTLSQVLQLLFAAFVLSLFSVYMLILVAALARSVQTTYEKIHLGSVRSYASTPAKPAARPGTGGGGAPLQLKQRVSGAWSATVRVGRNMLAGAETYVQEMAILLTALGLLSPGLRDKVICGAGRYLSVVHYLSYGHRRNLLVGQLGSLIDHVRDRGDYDQIHLLGYSFGSIVVIDTLFPSDGRPAVRCDHLGTLITIGCPYDVIKMLWPAYFEDRWVSPGVPTSWLNVYSPADVLSSSFSSAEPERDSPALVPAPIGPQTARLTSVPVDGKLVPLLSETFRRNGDPRTTGYSLTKVLDTLMMMGLAAHATYWEAHYEGEVSCLHNVADRLHQALTAPGAG